VPPQHGSIRFAVAVHPLDLELKQHGSVAKSSHRQFNPIQITVRPGSGDLRELLIGGDNGAAPNVWIQSRLLLIENCSVGCNRRTKNQQ
jgi:hypothetical protein